MTLLVFLFIILGLTIVGLVFAVTSFVFLLRDKVPYVATPRWVMEWLASQAGIKDGTTVVEIGCGDARVLRALKRRHSTIRAVGYERNWWPYLLARIRSRGNDVVIRRMSFYDADLRSTDIVYCYLISSVMPRVGAFLQQGLPRGATVYSYGFHFPDWKPERVITNPKRPQGSKLFQYRV